MTLDGYCDHTAMVPDDETMKHFNALLRNADVLIYGRITYQLMESYWPSVVKTPADDKLANEFAVLIDNISKIVYSRTLKNVEWKNSELKSEIIKDELLKLKQQEGKNILVGSPALITALAQLELVDEFQLLVHPVILGSGLQLFKNIIERINLKLIDAKTIGSGTVLLYYKFVKK